MRPYQKKAVRRALAEIQRDVAAIATAVEGDSHLIARAAIRRLMTHVQDIQTHIPLAKANPVGV